MALKRTVLFVCLACAFTGGAEGQYRGLTIPGATGDMPRYSFPPANAPIGGVYPYPGSRICSDELKKQRELNALLQKKIDVLETRLAEVDKSAKRER